MPSMIPFDGIPVPTSGTLADYRKEFGQPSSTHHASGHSDYRWHRDADTILLLDFGSHRMTATIAAPIMSDVAAIYDRACERGVTG